MRGGGKGGLTETQAFAHAGSDGNDVFDRSAHLNAWPMDVERAKVEEVK